MKRNLSLTLVIVLLASLLAGCGASASRDYATKNEIALEAPMAAPMEPMAEEIGIAQDNAMSAGGQTDQSFAIPENRKWIITVDISAETEDLDSLMAALDERIAALKAEPETLRNAEDLALLIVSVRAS